MLDSTLSTIESKVDECRDLLEQLVESVIGSDIHDELTGLEYSKVFATIAFTFCSLRYVQEKLNGHNPANHPVSRDLVRVKEYMQEINDIMLRALIVNREAPEDKSDGSAQDRSLYNTAFCIW
ncbi:-Nuclear nucleic acid-binding protein C1D [Babesia bigemina]|uniref:Nuclear nucleic acid-binding protein C1D n=1 Tax=Babesia bigemina TaxID=5866 RepID=A0A061DCI2_BABBI|nr:-Nuclear nucleic acid-binding protein C1D [Babesia bigemina]CDR97792.1 -Nuclear nucleic acid-binding protein C1D [Babesia bigemina]|eukprot:XP_012769978.1 -Nuclear nucleic acid-binding protein C1D [Babesia bigemina]